MAAHVQISRWILLAVGVSLGVALAPPIRAQGAKQLRAARKLLDKIKLVDGAGSGLDADTVQGMTPAQIQPSPQDALAALKQVDGTGSELDADLLRGLTPQQIIASAGGGGLRVVDGNDADVGALMLERFDLSAVLRRISGLAVVLPVGTSGFVEQVDQPAATIDTPQFLYTGSFDCTGSRSVTANSSIVRRAAIVGGIASYAGDPISQVVYQSRGFIRRSQFVSCGSGCAGVSETLCCCDQAGTALGGPEATLDLSSLGLTPPFAVAD